MKVALVFGNCHIEKRMAFCVLLQEVNFLSNFVSNYLDYTFISVNSIAILSDLSPTT